MRTAVGIVLVAALAATAPGARAATTQIGAVDEVVAATAPSAITQGGFAAQIGEAEGTYAVPAGFDRVTAWSHSAGSVPGTLTFKVLRPTGAPQEFLVVGSDTRTVSARSVQTFPVSIPVRPGDRLGLSSEEVALAFETFVPADRIGFFGADPPLGTTARTDGEPFGEFKLDVAATLASDPGPPGATDPGPPDESGPPAYPSPPVVSRLRVVPRRVRAGGRPPSVVLRADVAGRVRFALRRLPNKGRARPRGRFARRVSAGPNRFRLKRTRALAPGTYRLEATPVASGLTGRTVRARFRIKRR